MDKYETGTTHNFKRIKSTYSYFILKTEYRKFDCEEFIPINVELFNSMLYWEFSSTLLLRHQRKKNNPD